MDSLWAPRISHHLMDWAMKQSTHQFHKIFFYISKCLACNGEKTLQLKITKKNEYSLLYNYIYKYVYLCNMWREWLKITMTQ